MSLSRRLVKGLLRRLGLELRRHPDVDPGPSFHDDLRIYRKLRELTPIGCVIDVGVADGTPPLFEVFADLPFYLFEPIPSYCRQLEASPGTPRRRKLYALCASDAAGEVAFNVHPDGVGSSMYLERMTDEATNGTRIRVPAARVDAVLADEPLEAALLKIDVQGPNLRVLRGCTGVLPRVAAIQVETYFHDVFDTGGDDESMPALLRFLDGAGFRLFDVSSLLRRPLDGAPIQIDLFLLRKEHPVFADPRFATPEQRRAHNRVMQ